MSHPDARAALNPAWSLMRCVFAFEICLIHLCSFRWYEPEEGWMAETVFMAAARGGTVGFLMLAGAILIGRGPGPVGAYVATRLRRWLPLLAAAQLLYLGFAVIQGEETMASLSWTHALAPAWYHLWFFYALGTVYLAVLPLRWYARWAAGLGPRWGAIALWAPVALLVGGLGWQTTQGGFWGDLRPLNLLTYCGYAWTGHALATAFPRGAAWGGRLMVAGVAGAALVTAAATEAAGTPVAYYFHRCSVFVALAAIGQFLVLMRLGARPFRPAIAARMHGLARLTLGIFIVHPLLLAAGIWTPDWALAGAMEWLSLPIAAVLLFTASAAVVWLIVRLLDALRVPQPLPAGGFAGRAP